jgi:Zn-finger nucleic acid-binding protein
MFRQYFKRKDFGRQSVGDRQKKINAKAFVQDFLRGASDDELAEEYRLNPSQLARLIEMLQNKRLITSQQISKRKQTLKSSLHQPYGPSPTDKDTKVQVNLDTGLALHCPSCAAPVKRGWEECKYCGVPLDFSPKGKTAICPHCFAKIAADSRFCMSCGRAVKDLVEGGSSIEDRLCPRCEIPMKSQRISEFQVMGCDQCDGLFVPTETFEMIQDRMDRPIFPADGVRKGPLKWDNTIKYAKCPICKHTMARTNFAHTSGILVDICRGHGIWFDAGELEAVMQFISAHRQMYDFVNIHGLKGDRLEEGLIGILDGRQADDRTVFSTSSSSSHSSEGLGGFVLTSLMEKHLKNEGISKSGHGYGFWEDPKIQVLHDKGSTTAISTVTKSSTQRVQLDEETLKRYGISPEAQPDFLKRPCIMVNTEIVSKRGPDGMKKTVNSRYICPSCRKPQSRPFEKCPECGTLVNWLPAVLPKS